MLHSMIKRLKFSYYKKQINNAAGDPRKFWTLVNEVAGRSRVKDKFPVNSFIKHGNQVTPDTVKELGQSFKQYFASGIATG